MAISLSRELKNGVSTEPWICTARDPQHQPQAFAGGLIERWNRHYRRDPMLHLFCGSCTEGHTRVNIRAATAANRVGPFDQVDLQRIYRSALADPPWSPESAEFWSQSFAEPRQILLTMTAAGLPGAFIGLLHMRVVWPVRGLIPIARHPIFTVRGRPIHCLNVFRLTG